MRNVLLLAMSTLPIDREKQEIKESRFYMERGGEAEGYSYYSQLEPVPRLLEQELRGSGEELDKIIVMCTDKTRETKEFYLANSPERSLCKESAYDFFVHRLEETAPSLCEDSFVPISIDENNIEEGVYKVVQEIRRQKEKASDGLRLYMDSHGGFRSVQLVLQAIVSLLSIEGIKSEKTYKVENDADKTYLKEDHDTDKVFDFVSGMNEFLNYGKSDSLEEYLRKCGNKSPRMRELSKNIRAVSDAIQLCAMKRFDRKLDAMAEWIEKNGTDSKAGTDFAALFIENIRADYGILLDRKKRTVLDKIKWCRKKGFIQQALTVVESQMPEELLDRGILLYDEEKMVPRGGESGNISGEREIRLRDAVRRSKNNNKKWAKDKNYVFESWAKQNVVEYDPRKKKQAYISLTRNNSQEYERIKLIGIDFSKEVELRLEENKRIKIRNAISLPPEILERRNKELLNRFLQLHMALKALRNNVNHAGSDNSVSMENVRIAITAYIGMAEKLYQCVGNLDGTVI